MSIYVEQNVLVNNNNNNDNQQEEGIDSLD